MGTEQNKTIEALQMSIQMGIDGREYYQKLSQCCSNPSCQELYRSLAAEEYALQKKVEEIYNAIREEKAWPITPFKLGEGEKLRTIFTKITEEMGPDIKPPASLLDALQIAIDMEFQALLFYEKQNRNAAYDAERDFYKTLAAQEREHYLLLVDCYEYVKDPVAWFVTKEHPSLNGA